MCKLNNEEKTQIKRKRNHQEEVLQVVRKVVEGEEEVVEEEEAVEKEEVDVKYILYI